MAGEQPGGADHRDLLIALVLGACSVAARWGSLPDDGLFHDDAWVVAGVTRGGWSDLPAVSTDHPGFSFGLMTLHRLGLDRAESFAIPVFVVGALLGSVLYLGLRRAFDRAIALPLAALAAVSVEHAAFAGRVKTYAIDPVVIIGLALLVGYLASRRWNLRIAAAWTVGSVVVGTFSIFLLVTTGLAGFVLVLHATDDRRWRIGAVAVQAVVQVPYLVAARSSFDAEQLARDWTDYYAAYPHFSSNPVETAEELFEHLSNLGRVYPGSVGWTAGAAMILATVGLVVAARRGPAPVPARFLLLTLLVACVGGYLERIPFGPESTGAIGGSRASLWLTPAVAFGLAAFAHQVLGRFPERPRRIAGPAAAAVAALLVVATVGDAAPYPLRGSGTTSRWAVAEQEGGLIVVYSNNRYGFFASTDVPAEVVATPADVIGFRLRALDPNVVTVSGNADLGAAHDRVASARRVVTVNSFYGIDPGRAELTVRLAALGFVEVDRWESGVSVARLWERRGSPG